MASKASLPEYTKVARWTVNDVCNWLMENKFSNFVPMFRESGVDGSRLVSIKDLDLRRMKCPNSKSLDLLRCIENIPGKNDVRSRGPVHVPPSMSHRPPPSVPQQASHYPPQNGDSNEPPSQPHIDDDEDSGPDDDYEWNDFEEQPSDSDSSSDYENNPPAKKDTRNSGSVSTPPRPGRHNAGQATIAAKLKTALKERQTKPDDDDEETDSGSDYDKPDAPQSPPPRPNRAGQSAGNRLPPPIPKGNNKPSPAVNRKGRQPQPQPESDQDFEFDAFQPQYVETDLPAFQQSDYEDPDAAPVTPQRSGRGQQPLPPRPGGRKAPPRLPDPDPEETYEVPDEDPKPPPPRPNQKKAPPPKSSARSRQPPPIPQPADEPQELYEDPDADSSEPTADDVYEDPDAEPAPPARPSQLKFNKNVPPIPKPGGKVGRPPPVPRSESQPDTHAPPVPRHGRRDPPKLPTPTKGKQHTPVSDEELDDYEKPSSSPAEPKHLPPRPGKKPPPTLDDLPGYMDMLPKESDEQENYEQPDPEIIKSSHKTPSHDRHKKKRGSPPPLPTEPEEKPKAPYRPAGAVPIIPIPNGHQSKADHTDSKPAFREGRTPIPAPRPIPHPRTRSPAINNDDETYKHRNLPPEPSSAKSEPSPVTSPSSSFTHRKGSVLSRPLPSKPTAEDEEIRDYAWFHDVTRQIADRELQKYTKNGMFLVRRSTKQGQPYTLVIFSENKIYNLPIRQLDSGNFALGKFKKGEQTFDHVSDLIEFFKTHTLILAASGSGQTRLKHALPR